jgi:hypothetical protein
MTKNNKRKNGKHAGLNEIACADNTALVAHTEPQFDATVNLTTSSASRAEEKGIRTNHAPQPPRRKRMTGRSVPFSIKLRADTLEYIYEIANERDVPLAQVIEELVEVHARQQRRAIESAGT